MATFIQRNKKKSALAALLLFIRTRKTVTALLLLLVLASLLFVSPSNFILHFPGGARVAAGVAWIAGKVGMDTSKWGLAGGKRDYGDLLAAFRAAKTGGAAAGWSSFMRPGANGDGSAAGGAGGGSLDFVKGSRKDLESKTASGETLAKPGSVQGVLNADDAKDRGEGNAVALNPDEVGGEREGLVKSAFAGGFANGSSGFSGNGTGKGGVGTGVESGFGSNGAYAGKGFFGGKGGATSGTIGDTVKGGLGAVAGAPKTTIAGGKSGRLSAANAAKAKTNLTQGMLASHTVPSQKAFIQLATGNGRAVLSVGNNCNADNNCPGEFAATNTGVIYDGGKISGDGTGLLTGHDEPMPAVPLNTDVPANMDPEKMAECSNKVQVCETAKQPYYRQMSQSQTQLNEVFNRMGGDCGDPCHCDPCDNDKREIHRICDGPLKQAIDKVNEPCDMPAYCADMGIKPPTSSNATGGAVNMCKMNTGSCGPDGFFGALMCFLGS